MIDLGRITALCTDCPQVIPIAGDLTMDGMKRHIYRYGYMAAESYGAKVLCHFTTFCIYQKILYKFEVRYRKAISLLKFYLTIRF